MSGTKNRMFSFFFYNDSRIQITERPIESTIDGYLERPNKCLQPNLACQCQCTEYYEEVRINSWKDPHSDGQGSLPY